MTTEMAENEKYQKEIDTLLQDINKIKSEENTDEQNEQMIRKEQIKIDKIMKDNDILLNELNQKKNKAEEDLKTKRKN